MLLRSALDILKLDKLKLEKLMPTVFKNVNAAPAICEVLFLEEYIILSI